MTYIVIPQYIINKELQTLALNMIKTVRETTDATIISVDDGGKAELVKPIAEASDIILHNEKNSGFAKTCNKGFQWIFDNVKEDCYIVCANNDIEVYGNWLKELHFPFTQWDNVAITGIIHCQEKEDAKTYRINKITEGGLIEGRMQNGGLWCSKKSILQKIGVFDPVYERGGFEDVDLFLRARDTYGMKIVMSGKECFWHKEGATRWGIDEGGFNLESRGYEERNRRRFADKWGFDYYTRQVWKENELYNAN